MDRMGDLSMDESVIAPETRQVHTARRRFQAALGLFLIWVLALGVMAVVSGRRPAPSPAAIEDR